MTLDIDELKNRLFLLEERYHTLSSNIHGTIGQVQREDEVSNQPIEATFHFRDTNSTPGIKEKIRKFVTFKSQKSEGDDQQGVTSYQDQEFPPPPEWSTSSNGYEKASLLSIKAEIHKEADDSSSYLEPLATSRPRLKITRLPPPASTQPPGPSSPPPPPSSTESPRRKSKAPPPPPSSP